MFNDNLTVFPSTYQVNTTLCVKRIHLLNRKDTLKGGRGCKFADGSKITISAQHEAALLEGT